MCNIYKNTNVPVADINNDLNSVCSHYMFRTQNALKTRVTYFSHFPSQKYTSYLLTTISNIVNKEFLTMFILDLYNRVLRLIRLLHYPSSGLLQVKLWWLLRNMTLHYHIPHIQYDAIEF